MYYAFINAAQKVFKDSIPVIADKYHISKIYHQCLFLLSKGELKKFKK